MRSALLSRKGICMKDWEAWEEDVCIACVHTGILSLRNDAALGDASTILAIRMCSAHLGIRTVAIIVI